MTTDTVEKLAGRKLKLAAGEATLVGMAKGAAMMPAELGQSSRAELLCWGPLRRPEAGDLKVESARWKGGARPRHARVRGSVCTTEQMRLRA